METKKCKYCQSEIDKSAIVCPNCKKDLRNWFVKHWIISIFLFIFIGIPFINGIMEWVTWTTGNNKNSNYSQPGGNTTWIWQKWYYVDDFWDKTEDSYITTKNYISWTFSNTATENSRLKVYLLINNPNDINIKLYEYAWDNPIKAISYENYNVMVKDKDWNKFELTASNTSDRLQIKDSIKLHDLLLKWWNIQFIIKKVDFPSEYKFEITNADWYWEFFN